MSSRWTWLWRALLGLLLVAQIVTIVTQAGREPHVDEVEYVHAAWLMHHGERLYISFFEHHPPFVFAALSTVAGDDVREFFVRGRILSGVFVLIALSAFAVILGRIRPEAPVLAIGLLFASQPLWTVGITAIRPEPFAMAFFWVGTALVLLPRMGGNRDWLAPGLGIGLVGVAGLWSFKWPFACAVVAAFWLYRVRRRLLSGAAAAVVLVLATVVLATIAPLETIWFFNAEFNASLWPEAAKSPGLLDPDFQRGRLFLYAPLFLRAWLMGVTVAMVAAGIVLKRTGKNHIVTFFLLLFVASLADLRFVFPWPALWTHYYLTLTFAAAALVGLIPQAVAILLDRFQIPWSQVAAMAAAVVIAVVVAAQIVAVLPAADSGSAPYWVAQQHLSERIRPGDTVWMTPSRHPVNVRDASYYWFGSESMATEFRKSPRGARFLPQPAELPFCRVLEGGTTTVRFITVSKEFPHPEAQSRCFEKLLDSGALVRTPFASVYEFAR